MKHVTSKQAVSVWLALIFAILFTGWLAESNSVFGQWTVLVVLFVAYLKARAIILYYMEVKHAPQMLRLIFEAWTLGVSVLILSMWIFQG